MAEKRHNVRLFVNAPLGRAQSVSVTPDQAHYLFGVMRLGVGGRLSLFNGLDGEWLVEISEAHKRRGVVSCLEKTKEQSEPPDVWLLFAPIKKARTDFIVEKACEMGARRVLPVRTEYTNSERIRRERLQAHAIEAAEQCGGTYVPQVADLQPLDAVLKDWPDERQIMFCDETLVGARAALSAAGARDKWAILIGPEGGFSHEERERLRALPFVTPVSLGPRILRADTAAVAALTLWQSILGDWA